jgi:hypothetical protein
MRSIDIFGEVLLILSAMSIDCFLRSTVPGCATDNCPAPPQDDFRIGAPIQARKLKPSSPIGAKQKTRYPYQGN